MTDSRKDPASAAEKARLRRDWLLLPLLSILTLCLMIGFINLTAKFVFRGEQGFNCLIPGTALTGSHALPNSVCRDKNLETGWTEYRFNSCGHRAGMECGPKPDGTYRIVMIGSSIAMGHLVEEDKTFATLVPQKLEQLTGKRIELYNEGLATVFPAQIPARFQDALVQNPDLVLWPVSPTDISRAQPPVDEHIPNQADAVGTALLRAYP